MPDENEDGGFLGESPERPCVACREARVHGKGRRAARLRMGGKPSRVYGIWVVAGWPLGCRQEPPPSVTVCAAWDFGAPTTRPRFVSTMSSGKGLPSGRNDAARCRCAALCKRPLQLDDLIGVGLRKSRARCGRGQRQSGKGKQVATLHGELP